MLSRLIKKYKDMPVQVKASFWFLISAFMQKGVAVITTPILTRLLSTTEYGQYSVFNSWLGIVSVLVTLNLFSGVYISGMVKYEDRRNIYTSALQGLCTTLVLIWTVIYLIFKEFFNKLLSLTTVQVLAMLVLIWGSAVFSFWSSEQRVDFKYRNLVIVAVSSSIAKPGIGILFVLNSDSKVTAYILGMVLAELILYSGLYCSQMLRGKKFFDWDIWKYALSFNIPLIPHYLSNTILNSSDRIMIEKFVGTSEAGIYSLAYSISLIMTIFNTALIQTLEPWMYKKIRDNKIEEIEGVAYPAFLLVAIANIVLIAFAPEVVQIFAPPEYFEAINIIPPVAMSVFFMFYMVFFAVFEFYYKETRNIAIATMSGAVLNIILNYFAIQIWGYKAAAYTTLICYMVYAIMHYIFMRRVCKKYLNDIKPYNIKVILVISTIFMICGFVYMLSYDNVYFRYGITLGLLLILIIKRNVVIKMLKELLSLRKNKK